MGIKFILLLTWACVCSYGHKTRMVCEQLDEIFREESPPESRRNLTNQGRPGKRGAPGSAGEIGPQGPPGPVNEEAVQRIEQEMTSTRTATATKLDDIERRLSHLTENFVSRESLELCDFFYQSKCFFLLMNPSRVSRPEAETACRRHGGHLANIYNQEHFEKAQSLIRYKTFIAHNYNHIWTGMNVDIQQRRIRLNTGVWAPYQRWFPNRPFTPAREAVGIHVEFPTNSKHTGMFDEHGTVRLLGGLCEKEMN